MENNFKEIENDILSTPNFTEEEIWYYENEWVDPAQEAYEDFCESINRELKEIVGKHVIHTVEELERKKSTNEERADKEIKKIQSWLENANKNLNTDIEYCSSLLMEIYHKYKGENDGK